MIESRREYAEAVASADRFVRLADERGDDPCLILEDGTTTFAEVVEQARMVARSLIGSGIRPGDRVGILMPTSPDFVAAFIAVGMVAAAVVPINTRYRVSELTHIIRSAELAAILTTDMVEEHVDFIARLGEAIPGIGALGPGAGVSPEYPHLRFIAVFGHRVDSGFLSHADLLARGSEVSDDEVDARRLSVRLGDVATISYTSGTTSSPKGCMLTHEGLSRSYGTLGIRVGIRPGDRVWIPGPLHYLAGYGGLIMAVSRGAAMLSQTRFTPEGAAALFARERPDIMYSPFSTVTDATLELSAPADLERVRALMYVSSSDDRFDNVSARLPNASVIQVYGLTESGGLLTVGKPEEPYEVRRAGAGPETAGSEVILLDPESDTPSGPGEPGEIAFRTPSAMLGYLNDEAATRALRAEGGWLRTGDLGTVNEYGQIRFLSRVKDMLKVGGENVSAAEIEACLETHPAVRTAQVVSAPDDRLLEVVAAFIEVEAGAEVTAEELVQYCGARVARYKVPRYVRFVTEWPMSTSKIQKAVLRTMIAADLHGGATPP